MNNLGYCLENGIGVAKPDEKAAVDWYRKAADKELPNAMCSLGNCLLSGKGCAIDTFEAGNMFAKAAECGFVPAQAALGWILLIGSCGFGQNREKAVAQFINAAQQNNYDGLLFLGYCRQKGIGIARDTKEAEALFMRAAEQKDDAIVRAWRTQQEDAHIGLQVAQSEPALDCINKECGVCLNKLWSGQCILQLDCRHGFHTTCLQQFITCLQPWVADHDICPLCRDDAGQAVAGTAI
jgi:hypothetical protein